MTTVAFPSRVGECLVSMKVDIECPGARCGDLPGALRVQPYQDPIRPQQLFSLSICRTDCSVTKIADLLSKETYPLHEGPGSGKQLKGFWMCVR
jgi:hypothetical protein